MFSVEECSGVRRVYFPLSSIAHFAPRLPSWILVYRTLRVFVGVLDQTEQHCDQSVVWI